MSLYAQNENYTLYCGKMQDELQSIPENTIDAVVTDPPYELGYRGKSWDSSGVAFQPSTWAECLRVLKPGVLLLAFGGSRTFHRIACAIEDAGFALRDILLWLYSSGYPKTRDIGRAIDEATHTQGEFIYNKKITDMKRNDGSRLKGYRPVYAIKSEWKGWSSALKPAYEPIILAQKPYDGTLTDNVLQYSVGGLNVAECAVPTDSVFEGDRFPANIIMDTEAPQNISRYFFCTKATTQDRNEGLGGKENPHPTVKPSDLMRYLVRLVTPKGGTVLDPFLGSGTTGKAVMLEQRGYKFIGVDMTPEYLPIAKARIDYALHPEEYEKQQNEEKGWIALF